MSHVSFYDLVLTGYSESQRLNVRAFDILQNIQISRLCDIRGRSDSQPHLRPRIHSTVNMCFVKSTLCTFRWKRGGDLCMPPASGGGHLALLHQPPQVWWSHRWGWDRNHWGLILHQALCHPCTGGCGLFPGKVNHIHILCVICKL